jgi:hypothetical protein
MLGTSHPTFRGSGLSKQLASSHLAEQRLQFDMLQSVLAIAVHNSQRTELLSHR